MLEMPLEKIKAMSLGDILRIEGIVIRLIPKITVSRWRSSQKTMDAHIKKGKEIYTDPITGKMMCVDRKVNSLGGKYLVTIARGQSSTVKFSLEYNTGVGDTINEALEDLWKGA